MAASIRTQNTRRLSQMAINFMLKRSIVTSPCLLASTRKLKYAESEQLPIGKGGGRRQEQFKKVLKVEDVNRLLQKRSENISSELSQKKPSDDVWIQRNYPPQFFTFQECVEMHKATNCADILDNEQGVVSLDLRLCMRTKKKTKFTNYYVGTSLLPHLFDTGDPKTKILALSNSEQEVEVARSYGGVICGGTDLIKQIDGDELVLEEEGIELVVCTADMLQHLVSLKDKLPNFPNKRLVSTGFDMQTMMNLHINGVKYQSRSSEIDVDDPTIQILSVPIGRLNMTLEQLEENWNSWCDIINGKRSESSLGPVIFGASMKCFPSYESFRLDLQQQPVLSEQLMDEEDAVDEEDDES